MKNSRDNRDTRDKSNEKKSEGDFEAGREREFETGGLLSEALKKVVAVGMGAAFMTEEGIRNYLGEMKVPKELLNLLLQGANRSKDELVNRVSKEAIHLLKRIDLVKELSKFAEDHRFKITAEIEILPKAKGGSDEAAKSD